MSKDTEQFSVRLPTSLIVRLDAIAEKQHRTRNNLILVFLDNGVQTAEAGRATTRMETV